jgi:hypothetical protein
MYGEWFCSSISALGGGSSQIHAPAALPPGKESPVPIVQKLDAVKSN